MDISSLHPKQFGYLSKAYLAGSLHHSFIFHGPSGAGKFLFALYLARFIQCGNNKEGRACEKCNNCKVSKDGFVIDTYIINKGKDENIPIEEIRELQKSIGLAVGGKGRKIYIINNAQNIGNDARQVLLKTLEEPPENSLIILITDEKKYLPKTILSRCPAIFFPRPKISDLKKNLKLNTLDSAFILYSNNLDLLQTLDNQDIEEEYASLVGELEIIFGESAFEKMNLAKELGADKNSKEKVEKWISILYNLFLNKTGQMSMGGDLLNNLKKKLDYDRIVKVLEKLFSVVNTLDTNVSKRILFEDFMLSI